MTGERSASGLRSRPTVSVAAFHGILKKGGRVLRHGADSCDSALTRPLKFGPMRRSRGRDDALAFSGDGPLSGGAKHLAGCAYTSLMNIFREQLTPLLAPKYLAELETQVVIDQADDDPQVVIPDISITRTEVSGRAPSAVAVAAPAPVEVRVPMEVPTRLVSIYIRLRGTARLVAVIELLSPVNKRRGKGRQEYLEKRRTFLKSPIHFIEIDLLRSYPRMPFDDPLPAADYLIMVCKAGERPRSSVWPISVRHQLPTIPIPLLAPDPPVPLDLGQALRTAYERARYDLRVDYRRPPVPSLLPADVAWMTTLLELPQERIPRDDR